MDPQTKILGNALENWAQALLLSAALCVAFWVVKRLFVTYLGKIAQKRNNAVFQTLSQLTRRTKITFLFVLSVFIAIRPLTLPAAWVNTVDKTLIIALMLQFGLWGSAFLQLWVEPYLLRHFGLSRSDQDSKIAAVSFLIRSVFYTTLCIWGLDNLGVNVSALIAGLGVGGVAVALATQNILGDLFASLSITLDRPFQVGDGITVGTFSGVVEKIGLKTTRVRSSSGEQLIFSNTDLLASRIQNMRRMSERRIQMRIGVPYHTPSEKLRKIPELIENAVRLAEHARFDYARLIALGPSSIDYELTFWVKGPEKPLALDQQQAILLALIDAFRSNSIEFAFPTQTVYLNTADLPAASGALSRGL